MSFTYDGSLSAYTAGATELDWTAAIPVGDLMVACYAFQNVAPGSGPWSIANQGQFNDQYIGPSTGWELVCWQAPSGTGVGIEVWAANNHVAISAIRRLVFATSQQAQVALAYYSGQYVPAGGISAGTIRTSQTAQVTGNQPAAPSIDAAAGDLVIAVGGDLMGGSGFGSPSGYTTRIDGAGGGHGNVEAAVADAVAANAGETGLIIFPNAAAAGTTRGATATLAIRPVPSGGTVGPILDVPMPADVDLGDGWTMRVTALDPVTGAVVSGVNVSNLAIEAELVGDTAANDLAYGPYMIVPGPDA